MFKFIYPRKWVLANYGSNDGAYLFLLAIIITVIIGKFICFCSKSRSALFDSAKNIVDLFNLTYSEKPIFVDKDVSFEVEGIIYLKMNEFSYLFDVLTIKIDLHKMMFFIWIYGLMRKYIFRCR